MFSLIKSATYMAPKSAMFIRTVYSGKVKWFNNKKGYGFIIPDENPELTGEIFVHQTNIKSTGFRFLKEGEAVEFDVADGKKGKVATNVTAPGGVAINHISI